jgi:hypothetical protein
MSNVVEFKVLKENAVINIDIDNELYTRLQALLMVGIPFLDVESAAKVLNNIKTSTEDPDMVTYHTRTILKIICMVEDNADKQGMTEFTKIDRSTGKPPVSEG